MARSELESFRHLIFNTIESIVGTLDGLDAAQLNWRPEAPVTNSLYAIATDVLGNAEENLLGTLCGRPHGPDYPSEFTAVGTSAEAVRARSKSLRDRVDEAPAR